MEHYFIERETLPEHEREINFSFNVEAGHQKTESPHNTDAGLPAQSTWNFIFRTNNGLFSYREVDYASRLLMAHVAGAQGSLLDMGCGYGVMGIVLAKVYGLDLTMCDVNPAAVRYAAVNAKLNGVSATALCSDGFEAVTEKFDVIITNPPIHAGKDVVFRIYEQAAEHLKEGGRFFLVIQKKHGAESHIKFLERIFNRTGVIYKRKGFFVICCGNF